MATVKLLRLGLSAQLIVKPWFMTWSKVLVMSSEIMVRAWPLRPCPPPPLPLPLPAAMHAKFSKWLK